MELTKNNTDPFFSGTVRANVGILPFSSSLESEDSSLELTRSDFETRIFGLFC